ncbi:Ribonuclease H-like protein [Gracilaria domingensis]|nr:Ribonuclease H-like protein [Gracilaria domingensis]
MSRDKFCGLCIFFVDSEWQMKSFLLAVRQFNPSTTLAESRRLSDILQLWINTIFIEFELDLKHLFSSTSDSGSDIRLLCSKLLPGFWDWCIPHLLNCALVDAFETSLHSEGVRNTNCRGLLRDVKKIIEHLNKSTTMRRRFEEVQLEGTTKCLKLLSDVSHRWLSTVRLLQRFLQLWDILVRHYERNELKAFPLMDEKQKLVELFSLMYSVCEVIRQPQATSYPAGIDAFLALCRIKKHLVDCDAPLTIYDPSDTAFFSKNYCASRKQASDLCSLTSYTRKLLRDALMTRFYDGYNGTARSLVLEMQVFFHPVYRKLRCLNYVLSDLDADQQRKGVKDAILSFCQEVGMYNQSAISGTHSSNDEEARSSARRDTEKSLSAGKLWDFDEFASQGSEGNSVQPSMAEMIEAEVEAYLLNENVRPEAVSTRSLLSWWRSRKATYPVLSVVAQSVLGHPASSAQIERDFGNAGWLLSGRRNRMDAAFVDMSLFCTAISIQFL